MAKYRKKPIIVEAVRLGWDTWGEVCGLAGVGKLDEGKPQGCYVLADGSTSSESPGGRARIGLHIPTLEGLMLASEGDWIIKGVAGEIYPCKPDIFSATYEAALDELAPSR